MKVALIVNPVAGQGKSLAVLPKVKDRLKRRGCSVYTFQTKQKGEATRAASQIYHIKPDIVLALGGDGTVSEIASGLINTPNLLGIVPCGTANVLAQELEIPGNVENAVETALRRNVRTIDVGMVNDRCFVLMTGVGFDAQVVAEVRPEVKNLFKNLAYIMSGVKALLSYQPVEMSVTLDGGETEISYFTVVGNARYYAGRYTIAKKALIDDGYLDVCIFRDRTIAGIIKFITEVVRGEKPELTSVDYYRAKNIEINSSVPLFVQADGDLIGITPVKISVKPKALKVLVP